MNNWKRVAQISVAFLAISLTLFFVPFIVGCITSGSLLNFNTESQWISFWGNYMGALIGGTISGCITLVVMVKTLEDNKKDRKRWFCDNIIELCISISNNAAKVTLETQKFLQSAKEVHHYESILLKNQILDDIWKVITKLEAKRDTYAFSKDIYADIVEIAGCINSFSINNLNYMDNSAPKDLVQELVSSAEYQEVNKKCYAAAKEIERISKELADHIRNFYKENTKEIM